MTDDKKKPVEGDQAEWDRALSDWDDQAFAPEVAKDVVSDKPAALSGSGPSRTLYRPPVVRPPVPTAKAKAPAPPAPPLPPTRSPQPTTPSDDDENATRITHLPAEVRAQVAASLRTTRGGGLGQFFARDERRDVRIDASFEQRNATPAAEKLPSVEVETADIAEGVDPFAELGPPRSTQATVPAESELDDLIAASPSSTSAVPGSIDASTRRGESLIAPQARRYDPEEETVIGKIEDREAMKAALQAAIEKQRAEKAQTPLAPPEAPTRGPARSPDAAAPAPPPPASAAPAPPPRASAAPTEAPDAVSAAPPPSALRVTVPRQSSWEDEHPAGTWLSDTAREAFVARAAWLEEEARALPDKVSIARGLLACSEILATTGDRDRAYALAAEARDLAPSVALAHRQARALLPTPVDEADYVGALEAEARATPAGPARTHTALLIAEAMQASGNADESAKRLEQAARGAPGDVRPAIARAARALARGDLSNVALRVAPSGPLAPIGGAIATVLRLRGVAGKPDGTSPASPERGRNLDDESGASAGPNEVALRAREALDKGNVNAAATLVAQLGRVPELAAPAAWLASSLAAGRAPTRGQAAAWVEELAEKGDVDAQRALLARALELGDTALLQRALKGDGGFSPAERVIVSTLAGDTPGGPQGSPGSPLEAVAAQGGMDALVAAVAGVGSAESAESGVVRAARNAGAPESRARVRLGRLLAMTAPNADVEAAVGALGDAAPPSARSVTLELAFRERRASVVSAAVEAWGSLAERGHGALAAALIAERAGDPARALEALRAARAADPINEAAVRAVAALEGSDLGAALASLADALETSGGGPPQGTDGASAAPQHLDDGVRAAMARVEAATRGGNLPDAARKELLARAHRAAPTLPIAAFLAEGAARRAGNAEEVLHWVGERRAAAIDPVESAVEGLREALLLSGHDKALAAERLQEAHRARPADVALRLLLERFGPQLADAGVHLDDGASWREARAAEATGDARTLWYLEAAHEYERAGDEESALRCSEAAAAGGDPVGRVARERGELRVGNVARLADELLAAAKSTDDRRSKREAYERLALLDATARQDPASALLWHRAIIEEELPDAEASLRHVQQYLVGEGRDDELEPVVTAIAKALRGTGVGEATAHAELAAKLRMRSMEGSWESAGEMVELATAEGEATLWSLYMLRAHARSRGDDEALIQSIQRIMETATLRPAESALQLTRAAEAAVRLERPEEARRILERATMEDPGDVVAWSLLARVRHLAGDAAGAAEASEALARCSVVAERQLMAWHDAGALWQDELQNDERAIAALEAAAAIDVAYSDVFDRLAVIFARRKMQAELASLLERRIEGITDPGERLAMEVRRGRALLEVGDVEGAKRAFESALSDRPDDAGALSAFADLCVSLQDWQAAEEALVRLARLLPGADEQREVYLRLGDLYTHHSLNLSRAEVAFKEVLKRAPDDVRTTEKLVEVYRRQNDAARAAELQQELVKAATSPEEKRKRLIHLSLIHEQTGHDNRRAEQTLEAARREFPQEVSLLRALAEFYVRHQQTPAVNILLDRAGGDARRALAAGRFSTTLFETLALAFELRGKWDAAQVTQAMLAALEGRPAEVRAAGDRAFDPRLDELLAPEVITPAMRTLLAKTGEALDAAYPVDMRTLKAAAAPADAPLVRLATTVGLTMGLGTVQVFVSSKLGPACIPVSSAPPVLLLGEPLLQPDRERTARFLVLRALKLLRVKAATFARTPPAELAVLVAAWLKCFNPTWQPQGINAAALNAAGGRLQAALPRNRDPDVALLALEVAGTLGTQATTLAANSLIWANRVALLALGGPNDAIDAIAAAGGLPGGAPRDPKERATWLARTPEARDVLAFGVTDAFAEARSRLGIDR
jgi:tetratricopeptide (TPR) repeat protein